MPKNLLSSLVDPAADHAEVLGLLQKHFGSAGSVRANQLVYPSSQRHALKVYWKDGRISCIESGPDPLTPKAIQDLKAEIRDVLVDSPGTVVRTAVLFSHPRHVSGFFRTPSLQILPPSDVSPRPGQSMAYHPFYLEFTLRQSTDILVTNLRAFRFATETAWILNALLRNSVMYESVRSRQLWARCAHDPAAPWHSHWTEERYCDPGQPPDRDEFTSPAFDPIPLLSDEDYYESTHLPGQDDLVLPASISERLAAAAVIAHPDRQRLLRAARWLSAASQLWDYNVSSCYVALVAAIESLIDGEAASLCGECKQVVGVTKRFKVFVDRFVPGDEMDKRHLYAVRSQLVHGKLLFNIDVTPWAGFFHMPGDLSEMEAFYGMSRVAKKVVAGWLRSRSKSGLTSA